METYEVTRFYQDSYERDTVATGLTREEAQEMCQDDETSSRTCTSEEGLKRTEEFGNWFCGFDKE